MRLRIHLGCPQHTSIEDAIELGAVSCGYCRLPDEELKTREIIMQIGIGESTAVITPFKRPGVVF